MFQLNASVIIKGEIKKVGSNTHPQNIWVIGDQKLARITPPSLLSCFIQG